jgi:hypothetical protein
MILAPLLLENDDIKEKEGDDLIFQERQLSLTVSIP